MFTKKIKYTDYDGVIKEKTLRFNFNKAEAIDMQLSQNGSLKELIEKMIEEQDNAKLALMFKDLLLKSYGEKSLDGESFTKVDENGKPLYIKFQQTAAYSEMYTWLLTGEDAVIEFVNGIMPNDDEKGDDRNLVAIQEAKARAEAKYGVKLD